MTPLYFGDRSRRLFGLYTPAHASGTRARGAVICAPWGVEHLRAHRSMAQLGKWLGEAGVHVLRFDYHGTGDSAGDMGDARLDGWRDDVMTAVEELKDTAGVQRVTLVGLRLGAVLAAQAAAARRRDIDGLVLWDPVVHGATYLRELQALHAQTLHARALSGQEGELLGFPVSEGLLQDMAGMDLLEQVAKWPSRMLVLSSGPMEEGPALTEALRSAGREDAVECLDVQAAWLEDRHSGAGAVPVKLLRRVVDWTIA
ncbi:MAG: alpha/beta hydrolase [Hydrogenophaga sp.]|uniref:serine aminopeptidase domain-containing protein n=1 Tax=Hydrogenophaga sp. TaxID=1904254 RepID=UPI001D7428B9|nr:alpha/beta hydrolase [Hydrogenophaga sp.]MBX3611479.1 alpha/beta hydrolase [Hydrogenophaga sp.]